MTMGKTPDGRLSHPYIEGVNAFINSARAVVDLSGNIPCPCIHMSGLEWTRALFKVCDFICIYCLIKF